MDSGEIEFDPQPFSLKSLVTNSELSYKSRAKDKGLDLNSEFDLSLPDLVVSDSKRITQVLDNLIDNAVRFTDQGSILIKVEPEWMEIVSPPRHITGDPETWEPDRVSFRSID